MGCRCWRCARSLPAGQRVSQFCAARKDWHSQIGVEKIDPILLMKDSQNFLCECVRMLVCVLGFDGENRAARLAQKSG